MSAPLLKVENLDLEAAMRAGGLGEPFGDGGADTSRPGAADNDLEDWLGHDFSFRG